jgi:hypothetical protein
MPLTSSAVGLKAAAEESSLIDHVDGCNRVYRKVAVLEGGDIVRSRRALRRG